MGGDYDYSMSNLSSVPLTPQSNMYQGLAVNIDPSMLEGSKYVYEADEKKTRSFGEMVFLGTGSSYVVGGVCGVIWGAFNTARTMEKGLSRKLKYTNFMNTITKKGPFAANSCGVVALLFFGSSGILSKLRGTEDPWNYMAGGAATGGFFKCTAGLKASGRAAALGAAVGITFSLLQAVVVHGQTLEETGKEMLDAVGYELD